MTVTSRFEDFVFAKAGSSIVEVSEDAVFAPEYIWVLLYCCSVVYVDVQSSWLHAVCKFGDTLPEVAGIFN